MTMEKPKSVEVGMRFSAGGDATCTITRLHGDGDCAMRWDKEGFEGRWSCASILRDWTYLGSDTPSPRDARACVGSRWLATKLNDRPFTLLPHLQKPGQFQRRYDDGGQLGGCSWTAEEIERGCKYVGGPLAETVATPVTPPKPQVPANVVVDPSLQTKNRPGIGRMAGEMRAQDGTPLTALQAIQARPKPEPWRPSVDEYDLLPDAVGAPWIKDA